MGVLDHFRGQFSEPETSRPSIPRHLFKRLSADSISMLDALPTRVEIKDAVWSCGCDRAPGPDGYNFNFYRAVWPIIELDVYDFVENFFSTARLHTMASTSFIVLIPKRSGCSKLTSYHPISLVGSGYKIIAKIISSRLSRVIQEVVGHEQSTFIKGRQITESVLIANEVIALVKFRNEEATLFKIDFAKAFDCVCWSYLDDVLAAIGFGCRWQSWVRGCIISARSSVLINGAPTDLFKLSRGLRQGDSLSPFLYLIAAEGFRMLIKRAKELQLLCGISILGYDQRLSLLQYTDDTLIFLEKNKRSLANLQHIMITFSLISGLKINYAKSSLIGTNISEEWLQSQALLLGYKWEGLPVIYLGLPIGCLMSRKCHWTPVLNSVEARLKAWKGQLLSLGGRLTLVRSVLSSLPTYYLSIFKILVGVHKVLVKLMRTFLWSGNIDKIKCPLVKWEKVSLSRGYEGLGVEDLDLKNYGLLLKWIWKFISDSDAMWASIIRAINYPQQPGSLAYHLGRVGGPWTKIANLAYENSTILTGFWSGLKLVVGKGDYFLFWFDPWLGCPPLKGVFPELFILPMLKTSMIFDCGHWVGGVWEWRLEWIHPLFAWESAVLSSLMALITMAAPCRLGPDKDYSLSASSKLSGFSLDWSDSPESQMFLMADIAREIAYKRQFDPHELPQ